MSFTMSFISIHIYVRKQTMSGYFIHTFWNPSRSYIWDYHSGAFIVNFRFHILSTYFHWKYPLRELLFMYLVIPVCTCLCVLSFEVVIQHRYHSFCCSNCSSFVSGNTIAPLHIAVCACLPFPSLFHSYFSCPGS